MIFVDPSRGFNKEHKTLAKIQIDNSLELGWRPEDILLVTSFPYEYRGIYSHIVGLDCYYPYFNRATKICVISHLFLQGMIREMTWFHDFDAFQLDHFPEIETDFGITTYVHERNHKFKWNAGSFFFSPKAEKEIKKIEDCMWGMRIDEEDALAYLMNKELSNPERLDPRFNICIFDFEESCRQATKPILVAHFHPRKPHHMKLFSDIIPDRLKEIFKRHGLD